VRTLNRIPYTINNQEDGGFIAECFMLKLMEFIEEHLSIS